MPTACFSVFADADPSLMPRVLGAFARRGLVPASCYASLRGSELHIDIQMAAMEADQAEGIAQDLRRIVGVGCVLATDKRLAASA